MSFELRSQNLCSHQQLRIPRLQDHVLLGKFEVLGLSWHMVRPKLESFTGHSIAKCPLVRDIFSIMLRSQQVADLASLRRDGIAADLWRVAFGYAVKRFRQVVLCIFPDLIFRVSAHIS